MGFSAPDASETVVLGDRVDKWLEYIEAARGETPADEHGDVYVRLPSKVPASVAYQILYQYRVAGWTIAEYCFVADEPCLRLGARVAVE
jgi:hypothetical protein